MFIQLNEKNEIIASASFKVDDTFIETNKNIVRGFDGKLYFEGYAPQKPQELINKEKISEYQRYLADTDYVVSKIAEAIAENDEKLLLELKNKYSSVLQKRKEARNNIKELEKISTNFNQE